MEVSLTINSLTCSLCIFEVAHTNVSTSHADLALLIGFFFLFNFSFSTWDYLTNLEIIFWLLRVIAGRASATVRSTSLGHSVSIHQNKVHRHKILSDSWVDWG
jgi:hypothetical protein